MVQRPWGLLAALLLGGSFPVSADTYKVTDLGTLEGYVVSYGYGINNAGQVTGYSFTSTGYEYAFL